jgi:hypothetical protein
MATANRAIAMRFTVNLLLAKQKAAHEKSTTPDIAAGSADPKS